MEQKELRFTAQRQDEFELLKYASLDVNSQPARIKAVLESNYPNYAIIDRYVEGRRWCGNPHVVVYILAELKQEPLATHTFQAYVPPELLTVYDWS